MKPIPQVLAQKLKTKDSTNTMVEDKQHNNIILVAIYHTGYADITGFAQEIWTEL